MRGKLIGIMTGTGLTLCAPLIHAAPPIQSFETDSMARIVASQQGKPFVLVVWSLDCAYCQTSLKSLVNEKRKRKYFNVVTLATDPLENKQAAASITKKLASSGMTANAWAFGTAPPEQLRYAIDAKWHGEMPRSYWFDARGEKLAYSGVITPETIARLAPQ